MLWRGPSRSILDAAHAGTINLFTSAVLLSELEEVLGRDKFAPRIKSVGLTARGLTLDYAALATLVKPEPIQPIVLADPDDDFVLARWPLKLRSSFPAIATCEASDPTRV
jgi:uncharacterized protein